MKNRKREIRTSGSVRDEGGQHPHLLGRRQFLQLAASAAVLPAVSPMALAEAYPSRPITMIVPLAAGGPIDAIARVLAKQMRGSLGQPIIIENVSGADGSIATGRVARARPDGYTIELGTISTHMLNGALYSLPYDVLNDFAPLSPLVTLPFVLYARKMMAGKDLNELIAWLKANPNKASAGISATSVRLATALPPLPLTHVVEDRDAARRLHDPAEAAGRASELGQPAGQAALRQRTVLRTIVAIHARGGVARR